jgi:predicted dehydrogenase
MSEPKKFMPAKADTKLVDQRPQATDRKARIGVIGGGWWATTNHIPLLKSRRDVELVSVCGLNESVNQRIANDFGFKHTTKDYRELLKQGLDGVIVATPHRFHAEHALAALEAGCHVMVEKPMATHATDARRMVTLAKEKQRHLMVPFGWHYRPLTMRAKEAMERGLVGNIECVVCHMGSPARNLFSGKSFDYSAMAYVDADVNTYADPYISEGGLGQGQLSHGAGLLLWLSQLVPKSVFAKMSNVGSKVDMYDMIVLTFEGGAVGSLAGSVTVPGTARYQMDIRIYGSKGLLCYDIDRERCDVLMHEGEHHVLPANKDDGAYRCDGPPHQFIELIHGLTKDNWANGDIGLRSVEIVDGAYRSAQSGREEKCGGD